MSEDKIKNLLKLADSTAGPPQKVNIDPTAIRRRALQKQLWNSFWPSASAAAIILLAVALWQKLPNLPHQIPSTAEQLTAASGQTAIEELRASTERALNLIQEILTEEQRQRRLDELDAELAAIPDPIAEIQEQIDRTAFILVYSADRMYNELNLTDSAVETYNRVIELFPDNQWAQVARERLETIKNSQNKNSSQGEIQWKPQNELS